MPRLGKDRKAEANYRSLQALRAFAALLVVLYHVNHSIFGTEKYWPDQPFGPFLDFGHAGVEFFFVLSGFIIYAAHRRDIGMPGRLASFAWKRFRRVYPVYWLVLLAVLPIYYAVPSLGGGVMTDRGAVLDSFMLLHVFSDREVLTVSWSLFHEIAFYAVFAVLVANRRLGSFVLAAWFGASAVSAFAPSWVPGSFAVLFSPLHLLFAMGMATAWAVARMTVPRPEAMASIGLALFLGAGAGEVWGGTVAPVPLGLLYGLGSSLIVAGAVGLERAGAIRVPPSLVFLGNASYSIYLVHFVVLSGLAKCALWASGIVPIPQAAIYLALAVGAAGAGVAFHLLIENPVTAALGRIKPVTRRQVQRLDPQML